MKKMQKLVAFFMLAVLIVGTFAAKASADRGPKPSVDLTVRNAPGEYYIALLQYVSTDKDNSPLQMEGEVNETTVEKFLKEFHYERFEFQSSFGRIFNGHGDGLFEFHYRAPEHLRVILIETNGKVHLSDELKKKAYHATCTYDFATGALTEQENEHPTKEEKIEILLCLVITLVIELALMAVFRLPYTKRNVLIVVIVNVVTNLILSTYLLTSENGLGDFVTYFTAELLILFLESFIYVALLQNKEGKRCVGRSLAFAVVANLLSALSGWIPLG